jgi:hypothetical protein
MKHLKLLGLALLAAVALTASIGTGTAFATELCSKATTPCSGTKYGTNTTLTSVTASNAVIKTSTTTITCTLAHLDGSTTSAGGSGATAVTVQGTSFGFFSCKDSSGTECEVTTSNLGKASITGGSASETGKFSYNVTSKTGATFKCGFFINCTLSTSSATLAGQNQITGNLFLKAEAVTLQREGGLCPSSATWTGSYEILGPGALFVV